MDRYRVTKSTTMLKDRRSLSLKAGDARTLHGAFRLTPSNLALNTFVLARAFLIG
jgi:hypothetical protein